MLRTRIAQLALVALVAALGFSITARLDGEDTREGVRPSRPADASFRQPDAEGWGRAGGLDYLEAMRGGAKPTDRVPMVVLIHGLGDSPRPDWLDLVAHDVRARVVMPRAPIPWGERGYAWFPFRVGDAQAAGLAKTLEPAAQQLTAAIASLVAQRPTRGAPIVAGFSQGGMLSFALAIEHPERYAFVLPIAGGLPEVMWPTRAPAAAARLPIRALHGAEDTIVPIEPARRLVKHMQKLGFDAKLAEFPGLGHSIDFVVRERVIRELRGAVRGVSGAMR